MANSEYLAKRISSEVDSILCELALQCLLISLNKTLPVNTSTDEYLVAWNERPTLGYMIKENHANIDLYKKILSNGDYNAILYDGSVLQIAYKIKNGKISWHRLCFFPCPIKFDEDEISEGMSLIELLQCIDYNEYIIRSKLIAPIRFDYDSELQDEIHEYSHMSIGQRSCRIPVYGPLSVGHFFRFIFNNFYADETLSIDPSELFRPVKMERTLSTSHNYLFFLDSKV
jgi:hypothetical protein